MMKNQVVSVASMVSITIFLLVLVWMSDHLALGFSAGECKTSSIHASTSSSSLITRKNVLSTLAKHGVAGLGVVVVGGKGNVASAAPTTNKKVPKYVAEHGSDTKLLSPCNGQPVKQNCWSTEDLGSRKLEPWVPPSRLGSADVIFQELQSTISQYPQSGQDNVDGGGWKLAEERFSSGAHYARYEFTSGRFKYIDDFEIRVNANGSVSARSSSRDGGFDYGVNASRINYISSALQKQGWSVTLL